MLDRVDGDWLLETLGGLVAVPSWQGRERPAQEYVAEVLDGLGMKLDVWEIDEAELSRHPEYASEIVREDPLGVVGCWEEEGGDLGPALVLNGHVDVVPPGDERRWTTPPFEMALREDPSRPAARARRRVYGRGVLDMKGPLVAGLAGVKAVLDSGIPLRGSLCFHSVVGEEDGGLGTLAAVLRGHVGDGAIVLEPTGLEVAAAQAGALNFRLTVPGRAAHGALRHEGVSALEKFMLLYEDLVDFEAERNAAADDPRLAAYPVPYPICIGTVQGGEWASSVPESVRAEGRFGVAVHEDVRAARAALEARVAARCGRDEYLRRYPARVEWWGGQFAPCETAADARIVSVARSAARDLGVGGGEVVGVPYGSDLRHLVNTGRTPGVLFGPGDIGEAHCGNESIAVQDLIDGARAVALVVLRYLSPSSSP
ncbi:MAG: ArgE/DapE family deacylase [Gemmatimonadota bacterium]|nr:ArgE/DapE family deacylase [Gemmatimonadota bacterium]MDE2864988.1 ArgE/DapE family deacylase [Gemmatimonadota bacterium]